MLMKPTIRVATNALFFVSAMGASPQSMQVQDQLRDLRLHHALPASTRRDSLRERFCLLARQWQRETQWLSSTTDIAMHPAYQAIIGMGPEAIPMILEELGGGSGYWFWALKAISREDPVAPRDRGSIPAMRAAWLKWGSAKGLLRQSSVTA
ncbi:MAG: hypothetical protein AB7O84_09230 [Planctomycetota bacterium]